MLSARQSIEMFHLVFLRALVARGGDKDLFALKGGYNLRFFFASPRYSEDIDIDVSVVGKETLRNKVDRLLRSPTVVGPLGSLGIEIAQSSAPKQTDTTQRWKLGLRVRGIAVELRTKIEFSRRGSISGTAFGAVDRDVLRPYAVTPFLATHYTTAPAVIQKIRALAERSEPQPRDVFDLNHLLARPDAAKIALSEKERAWLPGAIEHAVDLSFDEYAAKVVAFLDPEQKELFDQRSAWNAMQTAVVERLESFR
jgi:predicted nucleotidyltransferase component of viral defense system